MSDCEQQEILAVQQEWLEHELNGNIAGVVSLCSDDVVWLPPSQPALRGQNAVAGWLAALPEHRIRRIEIINVRIYSSGDLAYKLADFTTWFEKAGQAIDEFVTGSHLWVLRESSPGHWQVAVWRGQLLDPRTQPKSAGTVRRRDRPRCQSRVPGGLPSILTLPILVQNELGKGWPQHDRNSIRSRSNRIGRNQQA